MNITKNFTYAEFEASATAKRYGILNAIPSFEVRDAIVALCTNVLQPLRDLWGKPLKINSGYRCPRLNALVGGAPTSQHTKGEAADIACSNPVKLAQLAYDAHLPFDQMILYPTFVHFSHKLSGEQRHRVLYAKTYAWPKVVEK